MVYRSNLFAICYQYRNVLCIRSILDSYLGIHILNVFPVNQTHNILVFELQELFPTYSLCNNNKVESNLIIIIMIFVNKACLIESDRWSCCDLSLSQASAQAVGGVLFSLQTLQVSLQTLFSMTNVLQEIRGFCARLHGLEDKEAAT